MKPRLFASDGVSIAFTTPADAARVDPASLPPLDLSRLPGATLVGREAFASGSLRVGGGCARGPSGRFVPGVEGVLLEKATWFALQGAELRPDRLEVRATLEEGPATRQSLRGAQGDDAVALEHLLGFVGPERDVLLCSVVCVGPEAACDQAARLEVEGALARAPEPGLLVRAVLGAVERPYESAAGLGLLGAALVAVILAKRPRDP